MNIKLIKGQMQVLLAYIGFSTVHIFVSNCIITNKILDLVKKNVLLRVVYNFL